MKPLIASVMLALATVSSAQACRLTLMGSSSLEYSAAINHVVSSTSTSDQSMTEITKIYNAYGAVVVETTYNSEIPDCKARVLDVSWGADCRAVVKEREGNYECAK